MSTAEQKIEDAAPTMLRTTYNGTLPAENIPNASQRARPPWHSLWAMGLLIGAVLLAPVGCDPQPAAKATANSPAYPREDLLIGYDLLANTLSDESRLGALELFKKLTLRGPNEAIEKTMKLLSEASKRRASELSKLRHLAPDVSDKPTAKSLIGDAINDVAKDIGKSDMMSRSGGFDIRFMVLQAQATRMTTAIATAIARFDPNGERKAWLKSLAKDYAGYRSDIMKYVGEKEDEDAQ